MDSAGLSSRMLLIYSIGHLFVRMELLNGRSERIELFNAIKVGESSDVFFLPRTDLCLDGVGSASLRSWF